jgi:hypothetical protein
MGELFPSLIAARRALWRGVRCFGRGLRKFGRAMVYLLPVLVLIHLIAVVVTGRQLQGDIERLTKAGIILPARDLIPSVPAGAENAADVYQKAWETLRFSTLDESALFDQRWGEHDANWLPLARRVVAANPEYYRLIDRASRMSHCAFPVDWEPILSAAFPQIGEMRKAARMLALRAYVQTADGRTDDALSSIEALFRVAQQAETDPIIIADLVSYAMQGIGVRTLSEILPASAPSPAASRSLYDQLAKTDNVASSLRAVKGEIGLAGMDVFDWVRSGRISIAQLSSPDEGRISLMRRAPLWGRVRAWVLRPLFNAEQRAYLSYMEREVRAFELSWPASQRAMSEQEKWLDRRSNRHPIVNIVTPVFTRVVWSRDRATAAVGTAQIALALKAYRADNATYPASLAELEAAGWKLPLDPFGGRPYRYRREGSGFVVWSLGPDMDDDNASRDLDAYQKLGLSPEEREKNPYDYDVIFRCAR